MLKRTALKKQSCSTCVQEAAFVFQMVEASLKHRPFVVVPTYKDFHSSASTGEKGLKHNISTRTQHMMVYHLSGPTNSEENTPY